MLLSYIFGSFLFKYGILSNKRLGKLHAVIDYTTMSLEINLLLLSFLCRTDVNERAIHNALEKRQVEIERIRCDSLS